MGIGSSIKKAVSKAASQVRKGGNRFENEYKRWGRQVDPYIKWLGYGMYAGQTNLFVKEGAKKSGYSDGEAASLGDGLGLNYQSVATERTMRLANEAAEKSERLFAQRVEREQIKARNQIAVRIRRGTSARPNLRANASINGGLGTTGSTTSTFASMLGL